MVVYSGICGGENMICTGLQIVCAEHWNCPVILWLGLNQIEHPVIWVCLTVVDFLNSSHSDCTIVYYCGLWSDTCVCVVCEGESNWMLAFTNPFETICGVCWRLFCKSYFFMTCWSTLATSRLTTGLCHNLQVTVNKTLDAHSSPIQLNNKDNRLVCRENLTLATCGQINVTNCILTSLIKWTAW